MNISLKKHIYLILQLGKVNYSHVKYSQNANISYLLSYKLTNNASSREIKYLFQSCHFKNKTGNWM